MSKQTREFIPINMRLYTDEDPDLIEYLDGKPKTWIIKEALRFYRDNHGKPLVAAAVADPKNEAAEAFKDWPE